MNRPTRARRSKCATTTTFVFATLLLLLASEAQVLGASFSLVADTSTPVPGGSGSFTDVFVPSVDGGNAAFWGSGAGQAGIYLQSGVSLGALVDRGTSIPGASVTFAGFNGFVSLDGSTVAFHGGDGGSVGGVYTASGGVVNMEADRTSTAPGVIGTFLSLNIPFLQAGTVMFTARSNSFGHNGIYAASGGTVSVVADRSTPLVGVAHGFFDGLGHPFADGGTIAFRATGRSTPAGGFGDEGLYTSVGGTLGMIANRGTTMPGDTLSFLRFGDPVVDGSDIVFRGESPVSRQIGIYLSAAGALSVLADKNTPIPGGAGNFVDFAFNAQAISGNHVAFLGDGASGQRGIYLFDGISLSKLIDLTDTLDGKDIVDLNLGREALDGLTVGFRAAFSDGSAGVYLATVPEPSTGVLLALGLAGLGLRRGRGLRA